mmetsp:Transcript_38192/g.93858  ORF Transcript_38192/g.93858 Transcript_38192/m.93858 type:complete len:310 (+) Transcript_38192:192-1121(+)
MPSSTFCTRGSEVSTPGSEDSTLLRNPASCSSPEAASPPAPPGAAPMPSACIDIDMASFSSSSSSSMACTAAIVPGERSVAAGAAAAGAGEGVAADDCCIDMARACCRRSSSSMASPPAAAAAGAAPSPPSVAPPSGASFLFSRSCRCRSSSAEMRSAMASSGSMLGSTPNSKSPPPPPMPMPMPPMAIPPPPSPSWRIGDEMMMSERMWGPGGTVRRLLFSLELTAAMKASNFSWFSAVSPKLTTSTATLFFLSFLPSLTSSFWSSSRGLPTKAMMRWRWFLFCLCFRASCATWMVETKLVVPLILML